MKILRLFVVAGCAALALASSGIAADPAAYGPPISLSDAKRVLAAAEAEAVKNNWNVVITILDSGGHLVAFQRMDGTQIASIEVSQGKAYTAVAYRRPTKAFQDGLAAGGDSVRILKMPGVLPAEGGLPLVQQGRIVGSIGVSGVTSAQDAQIGGAGAAVLLK